MFLRSWAWLCRSPGKEATWAGQSPHHSRALTIVLLLQTAQNPEDPSFWDFQSVCLLWVVGKLLPGPQLACGHFHLSGLTGAFLQLLLVIAGEAVPTQLSVARCNSPSCLTLPECLFCLASSGARTQAQELGDPGFSPSSAINFL